MKLYVFIIKRIKMELIYYMIIKIIITKRIIKNHIMKVRII